MLRKVLLVCLASSLLSGALQADELIGWREELKEAQQISQQYKVPMLIHFYGDQCLPCKTLEKNVFTRPEVASTMQRYFVPVRINATQDRRTAAEYGVHSWPTDVFVGPDGKVLTQGVCNQNPNSYLQNLQSVAVMNRDRNAMLAGSSMPAQQPSGATTPYGRTASANLQQAAPGRDQAPSPYSNPSSGPSPYAAQNQPSGLSTTAQSNLPSPTFAGQSAHGQATGGLIGSGPLASGNSMTVHPSESGINASHKDANLPQSVQWQTPSPALSTVATAPTTGGASKPGESAAFRSTLGPVQGTTVENPHFASQLPGSQPSAPLAAAKQSPQLAQAPQIITVPTLPTAAPTEFVVQSQPTGPMQTAQLVQLPGKNSNASEPAGSRRIAGQLVSAVEPNAGQSAPVEQRPQVSVPALSGFCPVALFTSGQWVEGQPQQAVRHRGRIYFLSSPEATTKFLASPDSFTPVLSGYDPLIFVGQGRLVEGSVYDGLKDPKYNQVLLFATPENKKFFQENYDRLAAELADILAPKQPLTAISPQAPVTR